MSEWINIENKEDVELSEDGKNIEVHHGYDTWGSQYIVIPVEFIQELMLTRKFKEPE